MNGRTGEKCQESAIYRCSTHTTNKIPLAKGNTFPPCPHGGGHSATWIFVQAA